MRINLCLSQSNETCLTLQTLNLVGEGLDVLLAVVHRLVERVVLGAPGHGDLLVHVKLAKKLLLVFDKSLEKAKTFHRQKNLPNRA